MCYVVAFNQSSDLNWQLCALSDLETAEMGILGAFAGEHQNVQVSATSSRFLRTLEERHLETELVP